MGRDIINEASMKIAGSKHGKDNEVKAQVTKARTKPVVKDTHAVVDNIMARKKMPKVKY
jgi:hypothetical protein